MQAHVRAARVDSKRNHGEPEEQGEQGEYEDTEEHVFPSSSSPSPAALAPVSPLRRRLLPTRDKRRRRSGRDKL